MSKYNTTMLEKSCRELVKVFQNQLEWKWDDRFKTVLAEFDIKDKESVQKIIKTHMNNTWNDGNCDNAPELVWRIVDDFRLNPGQQLLTSNTENNAALFCAWWPWGNGMTISIRIGVFIDSLEDNNSEERSRQLRSWFDV